MLDQQKVGNFIAALRKEKGLTQAQLAERVGVTNRSISRWENGNTLPDFSILHVLSQELEVSLAELLVGERQEQEIKDCIGMVIELMEREKRQKANLLRKYFLLGFLCLMMTAICWVKKDAWNLSDTFLVMLAGMGGFFEGMGFFENAKVKQYSSREMNVLTNTGTIGTMTTAEEFLQFIKKKQNAGKKQYEKAFIEVEKALQPGEKVLFALVADECYFNDSPASWHPVMAVTEERLVICGESIKGRYMTSYGVDTFLRSEVMKWSCEGNKVIFETKKDRVRLSGKEVSKVAGDLKSLMAVKMEK